MLREDKPLTGQNGLFASAAYIKIQMKLSWNWSSDQKVQAADIVLKSSKRWGQKLNDSFWKAKTWARSIHGTANPFKPVESEIVLKENCNQVLEPYSFSSSGLRYYIETKSDVVKY